MIETFFVDTLQGKKMELKQWQSNRGMNTLVKTVLKMV